MMFFPQDEYPIGLHPPLNIGDQVTKALQPMIYDPDMHRSSSPRAHYYISQLFVCFNELERNVISFIRHNLWYAESGDIFIDT